MYFVWIIADLQQAENSTPFNIVASRDGHLYEIRENDFMRVSMRQDDIQELDEVKEQVEFKLPKIPGQYMATTLAFFRYFCEKEVEALVYIYWDRKTQGYELVCPKQSVRAEEVISVIEPCADKEIVAVIHSHHSMPAFFSPVDNKNDQAFKVYGVIGALDRITLK